MKRLLLCLLLLPLVANAKTDLCIDLKDARLQAAPYYTNRTVWVQAMSVPNAQSPSVVLGATFQGQTDSNGTMWYSNAQPYLYLITVRASIYGGVQEQFKVLITATNLGAIYAADNLAADSAATFPAGSVAWAAAVTDARYAKVGTAGVGVAAGTNVVAVTNGNLVTINSAAQRSQSPLTTDVDAASHAITNATTVSADNFVGAYAGNGAAITNVQDGTTITNSQSLQLGKSVNLWRMGRINTLLQTRDTSSANPVRIVTFGDSTSEYFRSPGRVIADTLGNMYGVQEQEWENDADNIYWVSQFAGAATWNNADTNFSLSAYLNLQAGGTFTLTNASATDGNGYVTSVSVYYRVWPQGGSFQVMDDQVLAGTFVANATINANGSTYAIAKTNITVRAGNVAHCKLRISGVSGTNIIGIVTFFKTGPSQQANAKTSFVQLGQGGLGMDTFLQSPNNTNTIQTTFTALNPDLVIWKCNHIGTWTGSYFTNLQNFVAYVTNANPNAEILFIGNPPCVTDTSWPTANATLHDFAQTNGYMFAEIGAGIPTNWMAQSGWFVSNDGTHQTTKAYHAMLQPFFQQWGWLPSQPNTAVTRIQRLQVGNTSAATANDELAPLQVSDTLSASQFSLKFDAQTSGVNFYDGTQAFLHYGLGSTWLMTHGDTLLFVNNNIIQGGFGASTTNAPFYATVGFAGSAAGLTNYPAATSLTLGTVKPDGASIFVDGNGVISSVASGGTAYAGYTAYPTNSVLTNNTSGNAATATFAQSANASTIVGGGTGGQLALNTIATNNSISVGDVPVVTSASTMKYLAFTNAVNAIINPIGSGLRTVWVDATNGNDAWSGTDAGHPVASIKQASTIANGSNWVWRLSPGQVYDLGTNTPWVINQGTIVFADGATITTTNNTANVFGQTILYVVGDCYVRGGLYWGNAPALTFQFPIFIACTNATGLPAMNCTFDSVTVSNFSDGFYNVNLNNGTRPVNLLVKNSTIYSGFDCVNLAPTGGGGSPLSKYYFENSRFLLINTNGGALQRGIVGVNGNWYITGCDIQAPLSSSVFYGVNPQNSATFWLAGTAINANSNVNTSFTIKNESARATKVFGHPYDEGTVSGSVTYIGGPTNTAMIGGVISTDGSNWLWTLNGASMTNVQVDALNIVSNTVPAARLGSGTANGTVFLRGDQVWAPAGDVTANVNNYFAGSNVFHGMTYSDSASNYFANLNVSTLGATAFSATSLFTGKTNVGVLGTDSNGLLVTNDWTVQRGSSIGSNIFASTQVAQLTTNYMAGVTNSGGYSLTNPVFGIIATGATTNAGVVTLPDSGSGWPVITNNESLAWTSVAPITVNSIYGQTGGAANYGMISNYSKVMLSTGGNTFLSLQPGDSSGDIDMYSLNTNTYGTHWSFYLGGTSLGGYLPAQNPASMTLYNPVSHQSWVFRTNGSLSSLIIQSKTNYSEYFVLYTNVFPAQDNFANLAPGGMALWLSNGYALYSISTNSVSLTASTNQLWSASASATYSNLYVQNLLTGKTNVGVLGTDANGLLITNDWTVQRGSAILTNLAARSGADLFNTRVDALLIASNTVPTARLGSGTANSSTFLRGDQTWATPTGSGDVTQSGQNNFTGSNSMSGMLYSSATTNYFNLLTVGTLGISTLNVATLNATNLMMTSNAFPATASFANIGPAGAAFWLSNGYAGYVIQTNAIAGTVTTNQLWPVTAGTSSPGAITNGDTRAIGVSNGFYIVSGKLVGTNITEVLTNTSGAGQVITFAPGAVAGSLLSLGGANGLSNTVETLGGSNDIVFQAGYQTNNAMFTNGQFFIFDPAFLQNALGVAGQTFFTNTLTVTAGGANFNGIVTNNSGALYQTNALTWSTIQCTNYDTFWAFATNVTISGWQGINQKGRQEGYVDFSNAASGLITVTWPAGTRLMGGYTTNQPMNTCTVTNGKMAEAKWVLRSHLGQTTTQVWWSTQQN